ncbi:hypothetical protein [Taibaiella koreensis]|uniref:hypothetical protein n=1 Tax=Taibaiella koreensis TaxID=1268548 RepID=UPI0013C2F9ED|nr:hypothetical protein [Taibaiella koreensis]
MKIFCITSLLLSQLACGLSSCTQGDSIREDGKKTEMVSTSTEELGKLIDLSRYRPQKVKFRYLFRNNAAQGRIDIPGPSDYFVEALLYFDTATFKRLSGLSHLLPDTNRVAFRFDWLDQEVSDELAHTTRGYRGNPDFFFKGAHGKAYYLDNKILISLWTD